VFEDQGSEEKIQYALLSRNPLIKTYEDEVEQFKTQVKKINNDDVIYKTCLFSMAWLSMVADSLYFNDIETFMTPELKQYAIEESLHITTEDMGFHLFQFVSNFKEAWQELQLKKKKF